MDRDKKFDLRDRIILHHNQGVNAEFLKERLKGYLLSSQDDFRKIEEKPQSSLSLKELRLLVGRNILRKVHSHLEEKNCNKLITFFPLYLFSVWYLESKTCSDLGYHRGISLLPHVPFKEREDILMSTLCRKVLQSRVRPTGPIGKWCVDSTSSIGGFILSDDLWRWVDLRLDHIDIPDKKFVQNEFDSKDFGSFYLYANIGLLTNLTLELNSRLDETLSFFEDETTDGLRVRYTAQGDFDKESGCFKWKVKEDPSIKGKCGELSSAIFRRWTGKYESIYSDWRMNSVLGFEPFSFNVDEYKEELKLWL